MIFSKKIVKLIILLFFVVFTQPINAATNEASQFNWQPVIDAIIQVESNGNTKAKSGNSVGPMQITPILVKECNNILRNRNVSKRFKLSDRYSVSKSKDMFLLIQSEFNPDNNVEKAIRAWNGGNNFNRKRTQRYYQKVMNILNANE